MYYFQFKKSKSLNHDPTKKYNVYEAIKYMNEVHREQQMKERPLKLSYEIFESESHEPYLSDAIQLGKQVSFDFFQYTASRFIQIFQNEEETLIKLNTFLDQLEKQYDQELLEHYELDSRVGSPNKETNIELENNTQEGDIKKNKKSKRTKKSIQPGHKKRLNGLKTKHFLVFALALTVVLIGLKVSQIQANPKDEIASYEDLIAEEAYIEAAEHYPENIAEIERAIFMKGSDGREELKTLIELYPEYQAAQFDLAYLEQNYEQVIALKDQADSVGRKAQLAIAYTEKGNLEEAEILNQEIQNDEISKLIQEGYANRSIEAIKGNDLTKARECQAKSGNNQLAEVINSIESLNHKIQELETEDKDKNKDEIEKLNTEKQTIIEKL